MEEEDDVVFIEEYSLPLVRGNAPLSEIQVLKVDNRIVESSGCKRAKFSSDEQLQNIEPSSSAAKSSSKECRAPIVSNSEFVGVELQVGNGTVKDENRTKRSKKRDLCDAQLLKQREKKKKAIEREISASLKSKCEQYMFCSVSRRIFDEFPDAELHTRLVFTKRGISNQLICDEERTDMKVIWHRKCIEAVEEDGDVVRSEYNTQQHVFAVVLSNESLKELVQSKSLEDFVAMQKLSYPVANSSLILIIYGKNFHEMFDLAIELFDNYRVQFHYVRTAQDFALYLAQISRALAKLERNVASASCDRLIIDVEKGVKDAPAEDLVRDWWNKMLSVICHMQDGQRRAIMSAYPNPFIASKKFIKMGYEDAVLELANIQTEGGRRLGPVMAHRLFMILTDNTGTEIIY